MHVSLRLCCLELPQAMSGFVVGLDVSSGPPVSLP